MDQTQCSHEHTYICIYLYDRFEIRLHTCPYKQLTITLLFTNCSSVDNSHSLHSVYKYIVHLSGVYNQKNVFQARKIHINNPPNQINDWNVELFTSCMQKNAWWKYMFVDCKKLLTDGENSKIAFHVFANMWSKCLIWLQVVTVGCCPYRVGKICQNRYVIIW